MIDRAHERNGWAAEGCLSDDRVIEFVERRLLAPEREAVELHIDACGEGHAKFRSSTWGAMRNP